MSKDNSGTVMVAFVIGALTGAAVALLFAPASGEETRELISRKARESRDKAREAMEEGREFYRRERDNIITAVERGREAYQQTRERGDQV